MSKTLTAEEWIKETFLKPEFKYTGAVCFINDNQGHSIGLNLNDVIEQYANYLHKAKVESVTDEEIEKASEKGNMDKWLASENLTYLKGFRQCGKWLKQKLLEQ